MKTVGDFFPLMLFYAEDAGAPGNTVIIVLAYTEDSPVVFLMQS